MHKWKKYVEKFLWQAAKSVENVPLSMVERVENLMSQTVCFPGTGPIENWIDAVTVNKWYPNDPNFTWTLLAFESAKGEK